MPRPKPWYSTHHKSYSPAVALAVRDSVETCANLRRYVLQAAATMNYLYHREQVIAVLSPGSRGTRAQPTFLSSHVPWFMDFGSQTDPTVNITKSAVDSVSSAMLSDPPLIEIRPEGASFSEVFEWQERELALNATMNRRLARGQHRRAGRDGLVTGEGHIFPCYEDGDIKYRRLRFEQVLYDPFDAEMGPPTYQHMVDLPDRREFKGFIERLQEMNAAGKLVPDAAEKLKAIEDAPAQDTVLPSQVDAYRPLEKWLYASESSSADTDRIRVAHSWRRASRDGMDNPDGRYTITLLDGQAPVTVLDVPFGRTVLPVVSWSPFPGDGGIGGSGLIALLQGWQGFVDRTLRKITNNQDDFGYLKLLVNKNEFTPKEVKAFARKGIDIVGVSNAGTAAQWMRAQILSQEDITVLELAMNLSRSEYGINQLLTQGTSQLRGQVSGAAIVEEDAKTRDRLSDIREEFADFRVRIATATLHVIEDAVKYDPAFRAHYKTPDGESRNRKWSELTRVNGRYTLQLEQVGVLGRTRAGRTAKLLDLWGKNVVDDTIAKPELLRSPDLLKIARLQTAGARLASKHMRDLIRDPKDPPVPSKDLDLPATLNVVTKTLQDAMANGADVKIQEALRIYKQGVEGLMPLPQTAQPALPDAGIEQSLPAPPI